MNELVYIARQIGAVIVICRPVAGSKGRFEIGPAWDGSGCTGIFHPEYTEVKNCLQLHHTLWCFSH